MNPLPNHKNRQYQSKNDENSTKTDAEIMTFGPNKEWRKAWKDIWLWSRRNRTENTLNLLIDTFNLQSPEIPEVPFRNIIDILSHDYSLELLGSWASTDPNCAELFHLVTAATIELKLNQIVFGEKAQTQTRKILPVKDFYLLRLFQRELPLHKSSAEIHWMLTMLIWLLIHAMYRAQQGIYFSSNIQNGTSYLRHLIKEISADWSSFMRLTPTSESSSSFISLNTYLIQRIPALRDIYRKKDMSFQGFLGVVKRIATNEKEEPTNYGYATLTPLYRETHVNKTLVLDEQDKEWLSCLPEFPEDDNLQENGAESGIGYVDVQVDTSESYIHQKLSAKSRLIAYSEHLSHLHWGWERPTQSELIDLNQWIKDNWQSENKELTLLTALVWIAIHTGRTLTRVLDFPIKEEPEMEWTLLPKGTALRRTPPVRSNSWLPKTPIEHHWIEPIAKFNELTLPPEIQKILSSLSHSVTENNFYLANYWKGGSKQAIEVYFNTMMTGSLNRLKSGMLANVLPQNTFEQTNNSHLALMVGGHPQLALTGAFAYGSWNCLKVHKATNEIHRCLDKTFTPVTSNVIAFGSRVNPKETLIKQAIEEATQKLIKIDKQNNPIEFHNTYVSYLMVSLWAATGTRPVIDSFESIEHFNFESGFVFVNDKACDEKRMGRLVPLPTSICHHLQGNYAKHLKLLANSLKNQNTILSHEIQLILDGKYSYRLPYLFHIKPETLDWDSITPSGIDRQELFNWQLRHNLFRQRFAKCLPDMGVDQEIVDAWLGHKDAGIDTYGDFSIRCWLDDLTSQKNKIDKAFDKLGFTDITTWGTSPCITPIDNPSFTERSFGIEQRTINRKAQHKKIVQETKLQIEGYLGERKLHDLNNDELQVLEKRSATLPNGKRHPFALLTLGVLSDLVDEVWKNQSERIQLSKRLVHLQDNLTNVKASTPLYLLLCNQLRNLFKSEYINVTPSRTSIAESRLLVVFALLFENHISYKTMLTDIYNQKNFRLVKYRKKFYLEYSEILDEDNILSPFQRHFISPKTAHLMNNLLKSKQNKTKLPNLCDRIAVIVNKYNLNLNIKEPKKIIKNLSQIIAQSNRVELPGTVAAYLAGRVRSCSLNWYDWIRLSQNKILHLPQDEANDTKEDAMDALLKRETDKYNSSVTRNTNSEQLQLQAKYFFNEIRGVLKDYTPSTRAETTKQLKKLIAHHKNRVSSAIVLVVRWIQEIVKRGKFQRGKAYAEKSPTRYFSAIAPTFEQIAYNKDLRYMDSESVTELYSDFLKATEELEGSYHADQLLSFHQYGKTEGVEEPEWDELELPNKGRMVSPGIVTETDYLKSLDIILSQQNFSDIQMRHIAFLLFLCFRFGLRSLEAIGLTRNDWVERNGYIYLLIRSNHLRVLKTEGSRRIVPMLFNLTNTEQRLITEIFSQYQSDFHNECNHSLFALPGMSINKDMEFIRHTLIMILRKVTGNPKIVNHHLRHTFSNVTGTALYHLNLKHWSRLTKANYSGPRKLDNRLRYKS
ncbi:MAG: hypothetical protein KZQ64_02200 [gamma proteobacterium symbiont of Bathyaustriella thionipta]|nr:hypothetical protein [gamma proteobacterium symbiont of Bathyaustriella thionipta]MCU7949002.1 hypothetical protein [gamma proteobacterium symbiont of Bathyaustriella thionipta]MCU7952202.1 hypothetical protein [gamma proteobacterium symbiont of Bathyaustriella thionipta]MCU7955586.1 hypothetical protein [gamma proteobacterium symbiont of Bathyaustriella thionipta]MCU7967733.1 hypothetical protein [gamma proteobacterium symbiont of Bathyaustriella thionipta]